MEIEKEVKKVRLLNWSWFKGLVAETFGNALKGKATAIVIHGETFGITTCWFRANGLKAWLHLLRNRKWSLIGSKT